MKTAVSLLIPVVLAAMVSACGPNDGSNDSANVITVPSNVPAAIPSAPAGDADAQGSTLMAAAEPFEAVTEQASTASPQKLVALMTKAKASAEKAMAALPTTTRSQLAKRVAQMEAAWDRGQPVDVALQSVEAYRILVSNASNPSSIPKEVSLLDYSGFRYQANLTAQPPRWEDATKAMKFAKLQWSRIEPDVSDTQLHDKMATAIASMEKATNAQDEKLAISASTRELDLVDQLESFFAKGA